VLAGPRYALGDEIARGGMGVVLRATDAALGREVAVKVLADRFGPASAAARRFAEEARIAGQLQHPGIPPVHDLGTLPDGRPFLAMKLIKGRTLGALLKDRGPGSPNFVAVFEQVCQAVGYAHAHQVIHRDLKPANVMVGGHGEVQVMDWGLAKVLGSGRVLPGRPDPDQTAGTEIRPMRESDEAYTQAGAVLGTPAYMPPEQAGGEIDMIDERADVFGLGAILAVILTGQPPYAGPDAESVRLMAVRGQLAGCLARLDGCGAEPGLVALCKRCLTFDPADRPRNAEDVAKEVAELRAATEQRARVAELEQVKAVAEANEQRKRRRVQLALAAAVGLLLAGGGGFAWWQDRQATQRRTEAAGRAKHNADAIAALLKSCEDALGAGDADRAAALLDEVERRIPEGGYDELAERIDSCRADLPVLRALDALDQDWWTLIEGEYRGPKEVADRLREVLARFGIAPGETPADQARQRVARSAVRNRLVAALDRWLLVGGSDEPLADIRAVLRAVDPHPYRDAVRDAILERDGSRVRDLAVRAEAPEQPPGFVAVLGESFGITREQRRELLRAALVRRPGDLALLMTLGSTYRSWFYMRDGAEERVRWFQAAVSIAPRNIAARTQLGLALLARGDDGGSIAEFKEVIRLDPRNTNAHYNLAFALRARGDIDGAIASYKEMARIDPNNSVAHSNLGFTLWGKGELDAAIAAYKEAARVDPKNPHAHNSLAWLLAVGPDGVRDGRLAVEHATRACELSSWAVPRYIDALAAAYAESGDFDKAIKYQKQALAFPAFEKSAGPQARQRLDLYVQRKPYRDPVPAPPPREVRR
jgi:tetratricopeptide (TPR) repeat protein